jgi:hypothetical protein
VPPGQGVALAEAQEGMGQVSWKDKIKQKIIGRGEKSGDLRRMREDVKYSQKKGPKAKS